MKNKKDFNYEKVLYSNLKFEPKIYETGSIFYRYHIKQLNEITRGKKALRLLDIACGAGELSKRISEKFPELQYWACDISQASIKIASENPGKIKFFVSDAEKLKAKPNYFDIVIMNSVLDHLENPKKAISEVLRVLKPGGIYISTTPIEDDMTNIHGLLSKFKGFRKFRYKYLGHIHAFSRKSLKQMIEGGGFEINKNDFSWFYFSQIIDILYYPLLAVLGKGPEFSLNEFGKKGKNIDNIFVKYLRYSLGLIENVEDIVTAKIPIGFFDFIIAHKKIL
ncbi:MAG: methyltransferase domain-containing protein [bacterium]|nr:methyltransferase domain-containing protein [bacterium]